MNIQVNFMRKVKEFQTFYYIRKRHQRRNEKMSETARIFYQEDCNLSLLEGKTIAIIG